MLYHTPCCAYEVCLSLGPQASYYPYKIYIHIYCQLEHAESTAQSIEHASLAVYQLGHAEEGLHAQEKDNYISEDNL